MKTKILVSLTCLTVLLLLAQVVSGMEARQIDDPPRYLTLPLGDRLTVYCQDGGVLWGYVAPNSIHAECRTPETNGGEKKLSEHRRRAIERILCRLAARALERSQEEVCIIP